MVKLWPGHDSGTHKQTHTHTWTSKTVYAFSPFYGGGIKRGKNDEIRCTINAHGHFVLKQHIVHFAAYPDGNCTTYSSIKHNYTLHAC